MLKWFGKALWTSWEGLGPGLLSMSAVWNLLGVGEGQAAAEAATSSSSLWLSFPGPSVSARSPQVPALRMGAVLVLISHMSRTKSQRNPSTFPKDMPLTKS